MHGLLEGGGERGGRGSCCGCTFLDCEVEHRFNLRHHNAEAVECITFRCPSQVIACLRAETLVDDACDLVHALHVTHGRTLIGYLIVDEEDSRQYIVLELACLFFNLSVLLLLLLLLRLPLEFTNAACEEDLVIIGLGEEVRASATSVLFDCLPHIEVFEVLVPRTVFLSV